MRRLFLAVLALFLSGCSDPEPQRAAPGFIDIVWKVNDSTTVAPGAVYVFLSDGTLLITRAGDKPLTGSWTQAGGELTMVEEGLSYRTEILELTAESFRIRSHNPGEPVEISLLRVSGP